MHKVRVYYLRLLPENSLAQIDKTLFDDWLAELLPQKKLAVQRLLHDNDRLTSMLGLRLLKKCAMDEGFNDFKLVDVCYPERAKPVWQPGRRNASGELFDFNISHSHGLITVALSKTLKLGIDAEKIRPLQRLNFKMVLSSQELNQIKKDPALFFELWSKKEAVVKAANTAGLSRMRHVTLQPEQQAAILDERTWHLKPMAELMKANNKFAVYLATSRLPDNVLVQAFELEDLIKQNS